MRPLSFELLKAGCVAWIDARFNYIWGLYQALHFPFLLDAGDHERAAACLAEAQQRSHFLHFAGNAQAMRLAAETTRVSSTDDVVATETTDSRLPSAQPWRLTRTPVVLFIFNRHDSTAEVLAAIRRVQPAHLVVVADGPRPDHPQDEADCAATRALLEEIDRALPVADPFFGHQSGHQEAV